MLLRSSKPFILLIGFIFLSSCGSITGVKKNTTLSPASPSEKTRDTHLIASSSSPAGAVIGSDDSKGEIFFSSDDFLPSLRAQDPAPAETPSDQAESAFGESDALRMNPDDDPNTPFESTHPTDAENVAGILRDPTVEDPDNDSETDPEEVTYDIPIVLNESVEDYIEYFQTRIRDKFKLWLERSGRYIPIMREIFKEYGLPEDLVFVALIESGFNPYAYSRARAVGPWQFIKGTGRLYGLRIDDWIDERRDPIKSTHSAARYLRDLYDRFGSWPLAMAGYNAGEGKIGRALIKAKADDFWDLRSTRYIRRETKGYVPKFMAATIIAKNPERYGFTLDYHEPLAYDTLPVPGSADLRVMAQAAGISHEEIKAFNPELRTELTPPDMKEYSLRLPSGTGQNFLDAYARIPDDKKIIGTRYTVRRNDTLSQIAKRFRTTVSLLREINRLPQGRLLAEGDLLFIPKLQSPPQEPDKTRTAGRSRARSESPSKKKTPVQMIAAQNQGEKILYRVKEGDTLWDISRSFNVSVRDLKRYNGLGNRSVIRPGDQLVLGFESKDL